MPYLLKSLLLSAVLVVIHLKTITAQTPFFPPDTNYFSKRLILPVNMRGDILLTEGDVVTDDDGQKLIIQNFYNSPLLILDTASDVNAFLHLTLEAKSFKSGTLISGISTVKIKKWEDIWQPSGKILFSDKLSRNFKERISLIADPFGNFYLLDKFDKKDFLAKKPAAKKTAHDTTKKNRESGWIYNVSLKEEKIGEQILQMGRLQHSELLYMEDSLTVFFASKEPPSLFYKFIAYQPGNYLKGQLYAYKQSADGTGGFWLPMPNHSDSLKIINEVALRAGATFFLGLNSICLNPFTNIIYISEYGADNFKATTTNCYQGNIAYHNNRFKKNEEMYDHPYGGILTFNTKTDKLSPYLLGGKAAQGYKAFTNPSSITFSTFSGKDYLIIHEDLPDAEKGRTTNQLFKTATVINECWWLDLSSDDPTLDQLSRFFIAPPKTKILKGVFSGDGLSYFIPFITTGDDNPAPYNKSDIYCISGFREKIVREKRGKNDKN